MYYICSLSKRKVTYAFPKVTTWTWAQNIARDREPLLLRVLSVPPASQALEGMSALGCWGHHHTPAPSTVVSITGEVLVRVLFTQRYTVAKKETRFRGKIRNDQSCKNKTGGPLSSAETWTSSPWALWEGRAQLLTLCNCSALKCHKNLKHPVSPTYSCIL